MTDGSTQEVDVTWNPSTVDTSKAGTYTYQGTVSGYSSKVKLTLNIKNTVEQSANYDKASAAQSIVVKSSPGTPYKTLGTIKAGTAMEVYGGVPIGMDQDNWYGYQQYGWSKIKYKNNYAWVKTHELRFSNPYNWAPGIKEKFENDIVKQGYARTKESIQYKIYEKLPAGAIGPGFYQVYTDVSGQQSIVSVNVKTGWYHG
ncbi:Ig-like domain-containing protein [Clostridium lacusfryxellense]|nr:Ig-like domain-containing protein [Clostridium lacusfryxellense]